jgi:hypothetical protein
MDLAHSRLESPICDCLHMAELAAMAVCTENSTPNVLAMAVTGILCNDNFDVRSFPSRLSRRTIPNLAVAARKRAMPSTSKS